MPLPSDLSAFPVLPRRKPKAFMEKLAKIDRGMKAAIGRDPLDALSGEAKFLGGALQLLSIHIGDDRKMIWTN